jgi:hypothetical protein
MFIYCKDAFAHSSLTVAPLRLAHPASRASRDRSFPLRTSEEAQPNVGVLGLRVRQRSAGISSIDSNLRSETESLGPNRRRVSDGRSVGCPLPTDRCLRFDRHARSSAVDGCFGAPNARERTSARGLSSLQSDSRGRSLPTV